MNTMTELVQYKEQPNYCLITMDDGKANALSFDMIAAVNAALDQAENAENVVIICGRPGKFSAGFDLSIMGQGGDAMADLLRAGATLARRIVNFDTPVVLAVSGHALAMGALLCLSADYRIGMQGNYKIGLNEVAIGMTLPYFGIALARARVASTHLGKAAGLALALWLIFVVIYDLGLLGALLLDSQQSLSPGLFTTLLLANPTDAFRLFNMTLFEGVRDAGGLAGLGAEALPHRYLPLALLALWASAALATATVLFIRKEI